jgi:hypothetical protein
VLGETYYAGLLASAAKVIAGLRLGQKRLSKYNHYSFIKIISNKVLLQNKESVQIYEPDLKLLIIG